MCALSLGVVACGGGKTAPTTPAGGGGSGTVAGGGGGGGEAITEAPPDAAAAPVDEPAPEPEAEAPAPEAKPVAPEPPREPLDPVYTVKTTESREKMSADLLKQAKAAADKRERAKAIVLYQAVVVARGPASPEARALADQWQLAGDGEQAARVLDRYIQASEDPKAIQEAREARARYEKTDDPFAQRLNLPNLTKEATAQFKLGRRAYKKKRYGDALVHFRMGYALAPDLAGNLRELGFTYDKLGAKDRRLDFYTAYLVRRPFGKNADEIRKLLAKEKGVLGTLVVDSAMPCQELWLNGQPVPGKLPKTIAAAPGRYTGLCFHGEYGLVYKMRVEVERGEKKEMKFLWAVIENALEKPYGRIRIEDADRPGTMVDLGIDTPVRAARVPDDGRSLRMVLTDDAGTRSEERYIKLQPGQRHVIKW